MRVRLHADELAPIPGQDVGELVLEQQVDRTRGHELVPGRSQARQDRESVIPPEVRAGPLPLLVHLEDRRRRGERKAKIVEPVDRVARFLHSELEQRRISVPAAPLHDLGEVRGRRVLDAGRTLPPSPSSAHLTAGHVQGPADLVRLFDHRDAAAALGSHDRTGQACGSGTHYDRVVGPSIAHTRTR